MKVMIVGGGGREDAIAQSICKNPSVTELYALPGNGGMERYAQCIDIAATDLEKIVAFACEKKIDYAIVAPDDPLAMGAVDRLEEKGIPCFGPNKKAALIESSKVYAKEFMHKYGIPTAKYRVFSQMQDALSFLDVASFPLAVKADGLALGKGVFLVKTHQEAKKAIHALMEKKIYGQSGNRVIIEEYLTGPEISVLTFTDGKTIVPMVSSMDHKRAFDRDTGPNTGGMGAVAPNPYYTDSVAEEAMKTIFLPTIQGLKEEGRTFKGCLYFGLMYTERGLKVIEYNCRFGDPETQTILPLLKTDLLTVMQAVTEERLKEIDVQFSQEASCCVVLASNGYPSEYQSGYTIELPSLPQDVFCFIAGAKKRGEELISAGGRVLGITALGPRLPEAIQKAYAAAETVSFANAFYRKDIGKRALAVQDKERR